MDPVANIKEQVRIATEMRRISDSGFATFHDKVPEEEELLSLGEELAELVLALHEWRNHGGFDPYTNNELSK